MALATIQDVQLELMLSNEKLTAISATNDLMVEYLDLVADRTFEGFENLINYFKSSRLAELEAAFENTKLLESIRDNIKDDNANVPEREVPEFGLGKWALAIAATLGGVAGYLAGWYETWKTSMKFLDGSFTRFVKRLSNGFKMFEAKGIKWINQLAKLPELIYNTGKAFLSGLRQGFGSLGKDLVSLFKGMFEGVKNSKWVTTLKAGWAKVVAFFRPLAEFFKDVMKMFGKVSKTTGTLSTFFSKFASAFSFIAKGLAKIAFPLQVIVATIKGAVSAWNKEGTMVSKLGAFLGGAVGYIVGGLMDLVKGAISWILGALGFDKAEKWLDSFSFEELINNMIQGIFDFVSSAVDWVVGAIKGFVGGIGKAWDDYMSGKKSLSEIIFGWVPDFMDWMNETFSWKNIYNALPQWARKAMHWLGLAPDQSEDGVEGESNMNDAANVGVVTTSTPQPELIPPALAAQLEATQDDYDDATSNVPQPIVIQAAPPPPVQQPMNNQSGTTVVPIEASPHSRGPSWEDMSVAP